MNTNLLCRWGSQELQECHDELQFQLRGAKLLNVDGWGITNRSDPFFELRRVREDGEWVKVFESNHVDDNLNPT